MNKLPKPILGEITALTIATPELETSLTFYRKLGFSELFRADWPFKWIQITDGVLLIMLRQDPKPYLALTYYVKNIDKVVTSLTTKSISFEVTPKKTDPVKRWLLRSPDGLAISLVNITEGFSQPKGPGMLQMNREDYYKPECYINKTIGLFGELAHPVKNLEASLGFWKLLGFNAISTFSSPYPWAIISDGLSIVGLHQSTHFAWPAITYYAADMREKIALLKKAELKSLSKSGPGGTVLTTPELQHFFLHPLGGGGATKKKHEIKTETLETERLILKELKPETLNELFTSCTDAQIMSFLGINDKYSLELERNNWQQGMTTYRISFRLFLLVLKDSGKVIGRAGFHNWYAAHLRSEIGYMLHDEAERQKGYMKEALERIIRYGFEDMELNRIEAFVGPENVASQKLVRGFGFTEEGRLRAHFLKNGKMEDSLCFSLLKDEYGKQKNKTKKRAQRAQ